MTTAMPWSSLMKTLARVHLFSTNAFIHSFIHWNNSAYQELHIFMAYLSSIVGVKPRGEKTKKRHSIRDYASSSGAFFGRRFLGLWDFHRSPIFNKTSEETSIAPSFEHSISKSFEHSISKSLSLLSLYGIVVDLSKHRVDLFLTPFVWIDGHCRKSSAIRPSFFVLELEAYQKGPHIRSCLRHIFCSKNKDNNFES